MILPTFITDFLSYEIWDNAMNEYLLALLILIGSIVILKLFKFTIIKKLKTYSKKNENRY
ncbi:hypothetical protein ACFLZN_00640 [Nanoarchaeota archaeon]